VQGQVVLPAAETRQNRKVKLRTHVGIKRKVECHAACSKNRVALLRAATALAPVAASTSERRWARNCQNAATREHGEGFGMCRLSSLPWEVAVSAARRASPLPVKAALCGYGTKVDAAQL